MDEVRVHTFTPVTPINFNRQSKALSHSKHVHGQWRQIPANFAFSKDWHSLHFKFPAQQQGSCHCHVGTYGAYSMPLNHSSFYCAEHALLL